MYLSQFLDKKDFLLGYISYSDFMFLHNAKMYCSMVKNFKLKENKLEKYQNLVKLK